MTPLQSFFIQFCDCGSALPVWRTTQGSGAIGIGIFRFGLATEEQF